MGLLVSQDHLEVLEQLDPLDQQVLLDQLVREEIQVLKA
jgi:hypothetical protein